MVGLDFNGPVNTTKVMLSLTTCILSTVSFEGNLPECLFCLGFYVTFNNLLVIPRQCLDMAGSSSPPIKFWLNPTHGLGGDVIWRISRWPPCFPSWISEWNNLSNSESLCRSDASHQILAQSDLRFGRRCPLKNFKMAAMEWNDFSNSESLCHCDASHQVLAQSTYDLGGDVIWKISRWMPWLPSLILEWNNFSNSESLCHYDDSHQVSSQWDMVWEEMLFEEF